MLSPLLVQASHMIAIIMKRYPLEGKVASDCLARHCYGLSLMGAALTSGFDAGYIWVYLQENPEWEEMCAVACAVQNMYLMATSLGVAGYWSSWETGARECKEMRVRKTCAEDWGRIWGAASLVRVPRSILGCLFQRSF